MYPAANRFFSAVKLGVLTWGSMGIITLFEPADFGTIGGSLQWPVEELQSLVLFSALALPLGVDIC